MHRVDVEREFQRLNKMEQDIYSAIGRRQADLLRELEEKEDKRKQEMNRQLQIKMKSNPQIVKHPKNGHIWVSLANFINHEQDIDLDSIAQRQAERKRFRLELQNKTEEEKTNTIQQSSEIGNRKGAVTKQKVHWKLTRELRKREVEENKKRLERMEENKREKMSYYHRY